MNLYNLTLKITFCHYLFQVEQLTTDLSMERSASQKAESDRQMMEKQNKELKGRLAEMEAQAKSRGKAQVAALEQKILNLEDQLNNETQFVVRHPR